MVRDIVSETGGKGTLALAEALGDSFVIFSVAYGDHPVGV